MSTDAPTDLTKAERNRLSLLGYRAEHVNAFSAEDARAIIAAKRYRPGSAAYNKHQPPEMRVPPALTDEGVQTANAGKAPPSGLKIQIDEFTNACIRGENPLDAVLLEAEAAHPGMRFRLVNPDLPAPAGPQFQPAYEEGPDGKRRQVEVGGLKLGFMPETVYDEFYRQPNLKRSQQMMGQITRGKEDSDVAIPGPDAVLAPIEGKGLITEGNFRNL